MARISRPAATAVTVEDTFNAALSGLIEQVKADRSIVAGILCGSLSHDTVWSKSDIDLLLVTIDDKKADRGSLSLYADGINVHAILMTRAEFRRTAEGAIGNSFFHSLLTKGRLLYTHDESIAGIFASLRDRGQRDTKIQLLAAGCHCLPPLYKARKWLVTRGDLDYTAVWILYTANALARIEVIQAGFVADREVLPEALKLNPEFFRIIYSDILNAKKTRAAVEAALSAIEEYLLKRAALLFAPVIDHLTEVGEARSATEIEDHFERNFGLDCITIACEYLADQNLIGKASVPVQLTRRSNVAVDEVAFFCSKSLPGAW